MNGSSDEGNDKFRKRMKLQKKMNGGLVLTVSPNFFYIVAETMATFKLRYS